MPRFFDVQTVPGLAAARPLCLVVLGPELRRHPLPPAGELVVGRGADCAIPIDDPSVSRRHAVFAIARDGFAVHDLGSANGTRLRGAPVGATPVPVAIDEVVELGAVGVVIRPAAAPRIARASEPPPLCSDPVAAGAAMDRVHAVVDRIAVGTISVLILGETGVGKEVLAEAVHQRSPRAARPFLRLNCAALSDSLLESELFGHERGAFTGADRAKPGLLETADGGTVFLDEIGELPIGAQVALLRVIEQREVMRVGALSSRRIDVRFVAATHRDLPGAIATGRFREDLYFRLNGVTLSIPPLRARLSELEALTRVFLQRAAGGLGAPVPAIAPDALALLRGHRWPGNIRELRNVIERAVLLAAGRAIQADHIVLESRSPAEPAAAATVATPSAMAIAATAATVPAGSLSELRRETAAAERERILAALARAAGNQKAAAELLGISRRTLGNKLDQYAIPRPRKGVGAA